MNQREQGCLLVVILGVVALAVLIVVIGPEIEDGRICIAGGYAEAVDFNGTRVCVGVRDGAYTIEGLESVRLRLGLERGK